jgi:chemotaxis protein methyltransferase CheR
MTLLELNVPSPKLLGTDISEKCVHTAKAGIFNQQIVDSQVPGHLKHKYFLKSIDSSKSQNYRFNPQYSAFTKWKTHNLIESELGSPILFDFIFLRNVLIYFDSATGQKVTSRLMRHLKPGGHLIIGLSETIQDIQSIGLHRVENSVFRKDRA